MKTKILPTDKNGQVYYGPRTVSQAMDAIFRLRQLGELDPEERVIRQLQNAGYRRVAAVVSKRVGV